MKRVTLDTNVLVSAIFWNGDSNAIMELVESEEVELVLSMDIIHELVKVLEYKEIRDKILNKNLHMNNTVEKIISMSKIVEPIEKLSVVKEDPDDNKILECAKMGMVDIIISNDKHILKLKTFEQIKILTPGEFMREHKIYK